MLLLQFNGGGNPFADCYGRHNDPESNFSFIRLIPHPFYFQTIYFSVGDDLSPTLFRPFFALLYCLFNDFHLFYRFQKMPFHQ